MKFLSSIVTAALLPFALSQETTVTTKRLRGGNTVVHTRTTHQNRNRPDDSLVDPHHQPEHHAIKFRGKSDEGQVREVSVDFDGSQTMGGLPKANFHEYSRGQANETHNEAPELPQPSAPTPTYKKHVRSKSGKPRHYHINKVAQQSQAQASNSAHHQETHYGHRRDGRVGQHDSHEHHFDGHDQVESHHELHRHHTHEVHPEEQPTQESHHEQHQQHHERDHSHHESHNQHMANLYALPTGHDKHHNETLFEVLIEAPYEIYSQALGHELEDGESFPVFALPTWQNSTGVFSGFSKTATPLIFENAQFLLQWQDILEASSGASEKLSEFMADHNFHASLIIGKAFGHTGKANFLGMILSYYQFGAEKNVLVPFAHLEDFFDNTSEKHLLDPDTKNLEMEALHDMLEQKRSNSTSNFYHPALAHTKERKEQLEDLEIIHFQKLFQLLVRRSFLFSFGYADCLMTEAHELRSCLDDTFWSVVHLETGVRGALDDQMVEQLSEINEQFHSKVSEACITVQGSGVGSMMYGSGSCHDVNDLNSFVHSYTSSLSF